jgi:hypothetical protein
VSPAESYGEFASVLIERLTVAQQLARELLQQGAVQAKRYYDSRTKPFEYYVGDSVLVYYPRRRQRQYAKWLRVFSIEATVEKKVNDVIYIVRTNKTHQRRVAHVDKLKLICRAALRANDSSQNMTSD